MELELTAQHAMIDRIMHTLLFIHESLPLTGIHRDDGTSGYAWSTGHARR